MTYIRFTPDEYKAIFCVCPLHQFLQQQQPRALHGLTAEEMRIVAREFGPLLFNARFTQPLKRSLIRRFPELAA